MAYATGTSTDYLDFLDDLVQYITGIAAPTFTGTGTGDIHNMRLGNSAVSETWTLTFTSSTAFSVSGSVSGAQTAGVVGTTYASAPTLIEFLVVAGPTNWATSDTITIVVTANTFNTSGSQWMMCGTRDQAAAAGTDQYRRMIALKGVGLAGTDNIYVNLFAIENTTDPYYNLGYSGAIAFLPGQWTSGVYARTDAIDYDQLIGQQTDASDWTCTTMHNTSLDYWFNVDGAFVVFFAKLGTNYDSGCFGFLSAYGNPNQYPYPLIVGGSTQFTNTLLSSIDEDHSQYWDPGDSVLLVRCPDGVWRYWEHFGTTSAERNVWPWKSAVTSNGSSILNNLGTNIDGSYLLLDAVLHMDLPYDDVLGVIPKIKYIPGNGNFSENTVTEGADTYIVFQNIFRTATDNYVCMITS